MKEVDMGWACSARGKDCERAHNFGLEVWREETNRKTYVQIVG
jgi:hypothetical protein